MALAALGTGLLACPQDPGTSLLTRVTFEGPLVMTQLQVAGEVADGGTFGPAVRPERADRTLASGETLRILLPAPADGALASLQVNGLHQGVAVAAGSGQVALSQGGEVELSVALEPLPVTGVDAGTPLCAVSCSPGQVCVANQCLCTSDSCPGCCQGARCEAGRERNKCGKGGESCRKCPGKCDDGACD